MSTLRRLLATAVPPAAGLVPLPLNVPVPSSSTSAPPPTPSSGPKISFRDLPPPIFKYIEKHFQRLSFESPASTLPQIAPPANANPTEVHLVPNPFLLSLQEIPQQSALPNVRPKIRHFTPFLKRDQRILRFRYPSHFLPPSSVNPLPNPPNIKWLDGSEIVWQGEWRPKVRKGLYSNRIRMFKGHKREREKPARDAAVQQRLEAMDDRVEKWRKAKGTGKETSTRTLPF